MAPIIYADTLFLFNFFMDTIVLLLASRIINKKINALKIAVGAGFGGIYSVFMFFPEISFLYSWLFKIFVLFGISYMVFGGDNLKGMLKNFAIFIFVNITLGGALLALIFLTDFGVAVGSVATKNGIYLDISPAVLLLGVALTYTLAGIYQKNSNRVIYEKSLIKRFKIIYKNKVCEFNGFLDTGCRLNDPISDKPAIVLEYDRVKFILSDEEREIVEMKKGETVAYKNGMRVLPYSTINGDNAIYAIVADRIESDGIYWEKVCVGLLTEKRFGENYGGIVNTRLYVEENKLAEGIRI